MFSVRPLALFPLHQSNVYDNCSIAVDIHLFNQKIFTCPWLQAKNPRRHNNPAIATRLEQTNSLLHGETVPIVNNLTDIDYASWGWLFHPEDGIMSKTFVVFLFLLFLILFFSLGNIFVIPILEILFNQISTLAVIFRPCSLRGWMSIYWTTKEPHPCIEPKTRQPWRYTR